MQTNKHKNETVGQAENGVFGNVIHTELWAKN